MNRESHVLRGPGWQLVLADLALILFLLTLSALPASEAGTAKSRAPAEARREAALVPEIAPAQALYRPLPGGPRLSDWLAAQGNDPRATLTIVARHRPGEEEQAWQSARRLAAQARGSKVGVRIIVAPGRPSDLHASLAFDAPR